MMMGRTGASPRLAAVLAAVGLTMLAGCAEDRVVARGACPSWTVHPAGLHSNEPSPFLGCVNRVNLLRMVERPADLLSGRPHGPADGARESLAVEAYQAGRIKPFPAINAPASSAGPGAAGSGGQ